MDEHELSRREVLAGLTTVGGAGLATGAGATSLFSDGEALDGQFRAGVVDLVVEAGGNTENGTAAAVPISLGPRSRSGSATFAVRLPAGNNPVSVWLRSSCPDRPTELAERLEVTLSYDCSPGETLFDGTLRELAEWALGGWPLSPSCEDRPAGDQGCLEPGERLPLLLEWELDGAYAGPESPSFDLEFHAEQCRNAGGGNPFPPPTTTDCGRPPTERHGVSFVEVWACDGDGATGCDCTERGKLELEDDYCGQEGIAENYVDPGRTYALYDDGDDCNDTGYELRVTDATTKSDGGDVETTGLAFELLDAGEDAGPDLCRVDVKGGSGTITYDDPSYFDGNATNGVLTAPER